MTERFFPSKDEEYTAASWLTTLKVMQSGAERFPENSTTGRFCVTVAKDPENMLDAFRSAQRRSAVDGHTSEYIFLKVIGALDDQDKVAQGLSDAAFLLCDDPIASHIKENSTLAPLLPIVDELANHFTDKYLADMSAESLHATPGGERIKSVRIESDYWLREYDPDV